MKKQDFLNTTLTDEQTALFYLGQEGAKVNHKAVFIVPEAIRDIIISYGIPKERILGAKADVLLELNGCEIMPIPSAHEELHTDKNGNYTELGYKIIFDNLSIYHAGDCCIYEGLTQRLMNVDILMTPINGRSYYKRYVQDIIGNMTAEEALVLAKETNAGMIVPMHYDLYSINGLNPAIFLDTLYNYNPTQRFHMFVPGECYITI